MLINILANIEVEIVIQSEILKKLVLLNKSLTGLGCRNCISQMLTFYYLSFHLDNY